MNSPPGRLSPRYDRPLNVRARACEARVAVRKGIPKPTGRASPPLSRSAHARLAGRGRGGDRGAARHGLRREGFDVTWVATAAAALAAAEHELVLLDLRLPDRDGYEVCRELRGPLERADHRHQRARGGGRSRRRSRARGRRLPRQAIRLPRAARAHQRRHAAHRRAAARRRDAPRGELTVDTGDRRVTWRGGDRADGKGVRSAGRTCGPARAGGVSPSPARRRVGLAPPPRDEDDRRARRRAASQAWRSRVDSDRARASGFACAEHDAATRCDVYRARRGRPARARRSRSASSSRAPSAARSRATSSAMHSRSRRSWRIAFRRGDAPMSPSFARSRAPTRGTRGHASSSSMLAARRSRTQRPRGRASAASRAGRRSSRRSGGTSRRARGRRRRSARRCSSSRCP